MEAYHDCCEHKGNTASALHFEIDRTRRLYVLYEQLLSGEYRPGRSICFVITHPKFREVWAAEFVDRIVQRLLYNHIMDRFHRRFIANSCACIPGRGTLYAIERTDSMIRSITQNWTVPAFYLKFDIANCFVSIDKRIVFELLAEHIHEAWWLKLAHTILFHDPRTDYRFKGDPALRERVPVKKRLTSQPASHGLPIGNLSSQFFLNVLLNLLDQHVKHYLRARYYIRYVDDSLILGHSPQWLNAVHHDIASFLPYRVGLVLNESKTILQPVPRGVDFVGQVLRPHVRRTRRRVLRYALQRIATIEEPKLLETANSYFGLLRQSPKSHHDRAVLARAVLRRGFAVNGDFTKAYRKAA